MRARSEGDEIQDPDRSRRSSVPSFDRIAVLPRRHPWVDLGFCGCSPQRLFFPGDSTDVERPRPRQQDSPLCGIRDVLESR